MGSLQFLKSFACNLSVYSRHAEGLDTLRRWFSCFTNNQSGVTAIEYALIAALIAVAAIAAFSLVGTNLSTTFSTIAGQL
jgi:pilus assembly protein Flp/PilA